MAIETVLVVDDSPTDLEYLSTLLAGKGYQVLRAASAEESMEQAKTHDPDLILMDVIMPGMNGFEATRKLTKDAATRHIPVILCSNKTQETDRVWGMRQGARDYVTKPINEAELLSKISALG